MLRRLRRELAGSADFDAVLRRPAFRSR